MARSKWRAQFDCNYSTGLQSCPIFGRIKSMLTVAIWNRCGKLEVIDEDMILIGNEVCL